MTDKLHNWEKWPVGALFVAQGLQVFEWYVDARMPPEVRSALPWLVTAAGAAAFVAIDGAMIATVAGMRAGRRSRWSVAAIVLTAAFGAAVALNLHGALPGLGAWLHAGFAVTIATYLLHLAAPQQHATDARTVRPRLRPRPRILKRPTGPLVALQVNGAGVRALDAEPMRALPAEPSAPAFACPHCAGALATQQAQAAASRYGYCKQCKGVRG